MKVASSENKIFLFKFDSILAFQALFRKIEGCNQNHLQKVSNVIGFYTDENDYV